MADHECVERETVIEGVPIATGPRAVYDIERGMDFPEPLTVDTGAMISWCFCAVRATIEIAVTPANSASIVCVSLSV